MGREKKATRSFEEKKNKERQGTRKKKTTRGIKKTNIERQWTRSFQLTPTKEHNTQDAVVKNKASTTKKMSVNGVPSENPLDGDQCENSETVTVVQVVPKVELIEQSTNDELEDGEIEDDEEERPSSDPANSSIQVIDGEENIDTVIKEAYRDLPKLSAKVVNLVAEPSETHDDLEAQRNGLLEALKRKNLPARRRNSTNARSISQTRHSSKESTRRSRDGNGTANCQTNESAKRSPKSGARTHQNPASSRHKSHSGRSSKARERNVVEPRRDKANKTLGENFVLSPPPPPPTLPLPPPALIQIPQLFPQQGVNKVTKQPLLPTPLLNINFSNAYTSGINPIPPPPPRSTPFFPPYQTPYSPPAYNSQPLSMQSTSQYSSQTHFNQMASYSAPGLRQPPLLQEAARSSWSIEVDNFLQTNTKNHHLDNYEEVGMDLGSPASEALVEEEAVVESVRNDEDELETLRRNLLEQQQKSKNAQREVVLSRDCSPNTQKDFLPKKATMHQVTALQLEEIKTELEDVCRSIDDSGKRITEHSHRYGNLKKELEKTLNAIKSEREKLEEHFKRQLELVPKREWMELQLEKDENLLEQSQREENFYKDVDDELTAVNSLLYRSKHLEENIKNKARNSALQVTDHRPFPPLVEETRKEPEDKLSNISSPKSKPKTTRKRSNSDQRVRSPINVKKSEPRVLSEPTVITISSGSSKDPSLEENQVASESPTIKHSRESLIAKAKVSTRQSTQESTQRSFPNKKTYLFALANAYAPPSGQQPPRFVRIAEKWNAENFQSSVKYGVGRGLIVNQSRYRSFIGPLHGQILAQPPTSKQYDYSQKQHRKVMYMEEEVVYVADDIQALNNVEDMIDQGHSVEQASRVLEISGQREEQLDETLLRQELLARIRSEKANLVAISRPSTSKNNALDDSYGDWEPVSPNYHINGQFTDAKLHGDVLIPVGSKAHVSDDEVQRNSEALDKNATYCFQETKDQAENLAYNPVSPNYVPGIVLKINQVKKLESLLPEQSEDFLDDDTPYDPASPAYEPQTNLNEQAQNMDYQQDMTKVFDKVDSTYESISLGYHAKTTASASASCVLDRDAYQIMETLNGTTSPVSKSATNINDANQKEQLRNVDVYNPESPPYAPISPNYEPEHASMTISSTPLDTSLPLCSNELIYRICVDHNCRMQHMGNDLNVSTSTTAVKKPKSQKRKTKARAPKVYEGEEAEIADFIRHVYAELPGNCSAGYIENTITQLIPKWEGYKGKNKSMASFKKLIQKLIAFRAKRAENDGTSTDQAVKAVVLNQDPKMVPEYQSRIAF